MFDLFLFLFTIVATFHLIVGFLAMFLLALLYLLTCRYRGTGRKLLKVLLKLAGGFLAGIVIAWFVLIVLYGWKLPVWETVYAGFHSDIYGHEVEHAAEGFSLFMFFIGDLCAIATGCIMWVLKKHRIRTVDIA